MTVFTRNALLLTAEKASHLLGALALMILVARRLGPDILADYGFVISVTAFFLPLIDVGLNTRVIKASASREERGGSAFDEAVGYRIAVSPASLALMVGCGLAWGRTPAVDLTVLLVGLSTVAMSLGDTANSVFKGLQRSGYSLGLIGALNVVLLVSVFAVLERGGGLPEIGACYLVARLLYAFAAFYLAHTRAGVSVPSIRPSFHLRVVVDGLFHLPAPYFLGNVLAIAYTATYVALGEAAAGPYYVGYRAAAAVFILVSAGFEALLASATADRAVGLGQSAGTTFAVLAIGGGIGLYAVAPIAPLLFGDSFSGSVVAVRVLALCVPPFAFVGLAYTLLIGHDQQRGATYSMLILLGITTVGSIAAAYAMGPLTTAAVPTLATLFLSAVFWMQLKRSRRSSDTALT